MPGPSSWQCDIGAAARFPISHKTLETLFERSRPLELYWNKIITLYLKYVKALVYMYEYDEHAYKISEIHCMSVYK